MLLWTPRFGVFADGKHRSTDAILDGKNSEDHLSGFSFVRGCPLKPKDASANSNYEDGCPEDWAK